MIIRSLKSYLDRERFLRLAIWSLTGLGGYVFARFVANIFVARMLTPNDVGVMVLITSIRLGFELLADVGIEQNIVRHASGGGKEFLSTAWTIQLTRGAIICTSFILLSPYLAIIFDIDKNYLFAIAFAPLITSLHSPAIFLLARNLKIKQRAIFEMKTDLLSAATTISLVYFLPSVWSLIIAQLIGIAFRSILSYTLPNARVSAGFNGVYARDIIRFGRWIYLSSAAMFLSSHIDKVLLGAIVPRATFGLYGLARGLAEVPILVSRRMSYQVVFPSLSRSAGAKDSEDLKAFAKLRYRFALLTAICAGIAFPLTDIIVSLLYGQRYVGAAPVLSVLILASWIAIASNLNEARMLSAGKPAYESLANGVKLAVLAAGCPWAYSTGGIVAAAGVVAISELGRYLIVTVGLRRVDATSWRQDIVASCAGGAAAAAVWAIRSMPAWH